MGPPPQSLICRVIATYVAVSLQGLGGRGHVGACTGGQHTQTTAELRAGRIQSLPEAGIYIYVHTYMYIYI